MSIGLQRLRKSRSSHTHVQDTYMAFQLIPQRLNDFIHNKNRKTSSFIINFGDAIKRNSQPEILHTAIKEVGGN
jgi:hypothetical protein